MIFSISLTLLTVLLSTVITIFVCIKYIHPRSHQGKNYQENLKTFFFRFWFWFVSGLNYKEWAAVHRHNHINAEKKWRDGKPKSRFVRSIMYDRQKSNKDLIRDYGIEVPDSWIDRNIYNKFYFAGPILSFIIFYLLLNFWGLIPWVFNIFWMIFLKSEAVNADLILPEYFNDFLTSLQRSGKFYG